MVGAFQPVHGPSVSQAIDDSLHQIAFAKTVAGTIQTEDRNLDPGKMGIAKLLRFACGMEGIGEEQYAVARKPIGGEHRGCPAAHGPPTDDERFGLDLLASVRSDGGDTFLEASHRVRAAGPLLPIQKVEANRIDGTPTEMLGQREHAAISHMTAGTVSTDKERPMSRIACGFEDRRSFLGSDLNAPLNSRMRTPL